MSDVTKSDLQDRIVELEALAKSYESDLQDVDIERAALDNERVQWQSRATDAEMTVTQLSVKVAEILETLRLSTGELETFANGYEAETVAWDEVLAELSVEIADLFKRVAWATSVLVSVANYYGPTTEVPRNLAIAALVDLNPFVKDGIEKGIDIPETFIDDALDFVYGAIEAAEESDEPESGTEEELPEQDSDQLDFDKLILEIFDEIFPSKN